MGCRPPPQLRVIAGTAKGRKLSSVPGDTTRPILGRVKTALFDIVSPSLDGIRVLDLFAGSGSVGIEALSRGAAHCDFIDVAPAATATVKKNLEHTLLAPDGSVHCMDAFRYLTRSQKAYGLIYIAPPQYKGLWSRALQAVDAKPSLLDTDASQLIVQIDPCEYESVALERLRETRRVTHGHTSLVFYQPGIPEYREGTCGEGKPEVALASGKAKPDRRF